MSKIYINPGHGGADSGAVGTGGRREKDDVLRLATAVSHILASSGHDAVSYTHLRFKKRRGDRAGRIFVYRNRRRVFRGGCGTEAL